MTEIQSLLQECTFYLILVTECIEQVDGNHKIKMKARVLLLFPKRIWKQSTGMTGYNESDLFLSILCLAK